MTTSMKQKFAYMAVTMVAASLCIFLCLYLVVSGIMGQSRRNFSGNGRILRYAFGIKIDTMRDVVNKSANWIIYFLICLCLAGCARSSETEEKQAFKKETVSLWKEYFPGKEALIKEIQDAQ